MSVMNIEDSKSRLLSRLGLDAASRPLVVGLGKTGLSVARFLVGQGIKPAVADSRENPPGLAELREMLPDVAVFLGGFDTAAFARATHFIVSPGLALDALGLRQAIPAAAPVFGDVDLFACAAQAPIVGITGSNGKSTVTTLLGTMADSDGRKVKVGGNLGTPMLDLLDADAELYVLELSSFQLERSQLLEAAAATVLNISPDHMDRYPDIQAYADAKRRIFKGMGAMVLNADDAQVAAMAEAGRKISRFALRDAGCDYCLRTIDGEEWLAQGTTLLLPARELRIRGRHNLANVLAAVALADAVGLSRPAILKAAREFPGLEHRMQWVADVAGVAYINDSKATNVGACVAALEGLAEKAVLIAGGDGKGADFSVLAPLAAEKLRAAVLMGRDAQLLEQVLQPVVTTVRVENMKQAVEQAAKLALPGDTVLLAPACASLDQYKDYQERGRLFVEAVRSLPP